MTAGSGRRGASSWLGAMWLAVSAASALAAGGPVSIDVRLRTGIAAGTTIVLQAAPDVAVTDRTPGARPATAAQGPLSVGETFSEEITLELRGYVVDRPTLVDVHDALVSVVRVQPGSGGTTIAIAVRQPVSYTVSRPSAAGEIAVDLHPHTTQAASPTGQRKHARAVTRPNEPDKVSVDAETLTYEQGTNVLIATGNVTLTRAGMTVRGDDIRYDRDKGEIDAHGHVQVTDAEGTILGDSAHLNVADETGWIDDARGDMTPTEYSLVCDRLDKLGGPLYHVNGGTFTTCRCGGVDRPAWSLRGTTTDVLLEGHAIIHNATFRVLDTPVLWFPLFAFPAKSNRATGLLFPRFSYSKRRGFQWEQPFYWAIDKSHDLTVALDVETNARIGLATEYRYALSKDAQGAFMVAYYNEAIRKNKAQYEPTNPVGVPVTIGEDRFAIAGQHRQPLPDGSRFYLDMLAVSDDAFLREINAFAFNAQEEGAIRVRRFTTSRTGILKTWSEGYFQAEARYDQDLVNPQELTPEQLPRLEGSHSMALLGDHVIARLAGNLTDFQRTDAYDGGRLHLQPDLFLPFSLGPYAYGGVVTRLRETMYALTDTEQFGVVQSKADPNAQHFRTTPEMPALDTFRSQFAPELSSRLATELSRVYEFSSGKLRHTIEPEVRYLWVPEVSRPIRQKALPACSSLMHPVPGDNCDATIFSEGYLFNRDDAVNQRNFATWGLTTRLLWRGKSPAELTGAADDPNAPVPSSRELLSASITHGYDFSRKLVDDSHASDVDIGLRLSPLDWLSFRYDDTVSFEQRSLRGQTVGVSVHESDYVSTSAHGYQIPSQLEIRYAYIANDVNRLADPRPAVQTLLTKPGIDAVGTSLYLRLTPYIGFFGAASYDVSDNTVFGPHFVDWSAYLRLVSSCDCWFIDAGVHQGTLKTPLDDQVFRVQLTLLGLGSFGRGAQPNFIGFGNTTHARNALVGAGL